MKRITIQARINERECVHLHADLITTPDRIYWSVVAFDTHLGRFRDECEPHQVWQTIERVIGAALVSSQHKINVERMEKNNDER